MGNVPSLESVNQISVSSVGVTSAAAGDDFKSVTESKPPADRAESGTNDALYCPECYLPLHPDPAPEKLYIFLHALRYTSSSLGAFETALPEWAAKGYVWEE